MRNVFILLILFVFVGCNSEQAALTSIQGVRDPNNPIPKIVSVLPQVSGTYSVGAGLDFYVTYDDVVVIDGAPRLPIILDSGTYYADYISGSGTNVLYFQFAVPAGSYDYNGIQLTGTMNLNGGSIYDPEDDDDSSLTYSVPSTSGILINGINPAITSVTIDNGNYKIDDNLEFTVNYTFPVYVTGTPRLPITVAGVSKEAVYVSGAGTNALKFTYAVEALEDYNGIDATGSLSLVGATITDYFGDAAASVFGAITFGSVIVDGITPSENSRLTPLDNPTRVVNSIIQYAITYREIVTVSGTPRIPIIIGTTTRYANYLNGSGTNTIFFQYSVQAGELDTNGLVTVTSVDLNGGTIADRAGNPISTTYLPWPPHNINIDAVNPTVTGVGLPNGNYKIGSTMDLFVAASENVIVTGVPSIGITIGATTKQATYFSGSGTTGLTFRYVVEEGLQDTDGVTSISPVALNGGTIKDAAGNNAVVSFTAGTYTSALVDAVRPTISITTIPTVAPFAIWRAGHVMNFTITASENILVSGGTPTIALLIGSMARQANMTAASANTLTMNHTVLANDMDLDGISLNNANLILNGATLRDSFGNDAVLSLAAVDMSKVFVLPNEIKYWFDANDTLTTTGTTSATTFNSKANVISPSLTGPAPALVNGPNGTKFAQFTGSNSFTLTTTDADVVIATIKTPSANGNLWRSTDNTLEIYFQNFLFSYTAFGGSYCAAYCYFYQPVGNMHTMGASNEFTPYSFTWNQYRTIAVDYRSPGLYTYKLGEFNGQIGEVFILSSGAAISTALIMKIGDYLNAKHGANW